MKKASVLASLLNGTLAAMFALGGVLLIIGHPATVNLFDRAGSPREFAGLIGFLSVQAAVLLAIPSARLAGLATAGTLSSAAVATAVIDCDYVASLPPLALLAAVAVDFWVTPSTIASKAT
ncbi:DoxX family protein [Neorhizobium sp. NCHU2750]|uniref:DoxX family protein n=1 Tax=Neorhizobium sp. NCHU2750 TaxID=1825976 RepID=UPI000E73D356|nr:hypothetical protein NCHU2750_20760 [Neorhizobium sp. NCHU2750]